MYTYVYIYVCIFLYICVYIYTYIHTYIQIYYVTRNKAQEEVAGLCERDRLLDTLLERALRLAAPRATCLPPSSFCGNTLNLKKILLSRCIGLMW